MHKPKPRLRGSSSARTPGWTLTELLICLAVMSTLAALALPAYQQQQRQARRSDAQVALQQLQMDQARWRTQHDTYADSLSALDWGSDQSPRGLYRLSIAQADAEGYTLEAWPVGAQAADRDCSPLRLTWRGSATTTLSAGQHPDSDPDRCWRQ